MGEFDPGKRSIKLRVFIMTTSIKNSLKPFVAIGKMSTAQNDFYYYLRSTMFVLQRKTSTPDYFYPL